MNFWQRRPLTENLIGALLVAVVWLLLELGAGAIVGALGGRREGISLLPFLVATLLVTRFYDRMPAAWAGLGVHRWMPRELALGALLGSVLALIAWSPSALLGSVTEAPPSGAPLVVEIVLYLLTAATLEELLFRGYLFQRGVEILGPTVATILASALFAVAHLDNPEVSAIALVNIFLASIFFSLCYFATGSLWLPIAAHAAWNLTLALGVGARVSGKDFSVGWLMTAPGGPEAIAGGAFGPEGGLACALSLGLGIVAVLRLPAISVSPYVHARVFASVFASARRRDAKEDGDHGSQ